MARARAVLDYAPSDTVWSEAAVNVTGAVGPGITGASSASDLFQLDRLALHWASPIGDLSLGRQAWGHGAARVFPVTDVVRPFSPASVDTEFKEGVDMARWTRPFGESFELEALGLYDHDRDRGRASGLGRARILLSALDADLSLLGGHLEETAVAGLAAAGDLLGAGWLLEALWRDGDVAATAGLSRMFDLPRTPTLTVELLHNPHGAYPLLPGDRWIATLCTAELTPLVTADVGALVPLVDPGIPGVDHLFFGGLTASVSNESTARLGWVDEAFYVDVRSAF